MPLLMPLSPHSEAGLFNMYFMDSGAYSHTEGISGYDWIRPSQIEWFRDQSAELKARKGSILPSVAFFHIPIPEYNYASLAGRVGERHEGVAAADVNSGLFTAFLDADDVVATFVGHDHTNDYCGRYPGSKVRWACYGGGVGYGTYNRYLGIRTSRVIELSANGTISSWKRLDNESFDTIDIQQLH